MKTLLKLALTMSLMLGLFIFQSCSEDEDPAKVPTVTTGTATDLTFFTASVSGNVTNDGGAAITAKGIVYGTTTTPVISADTTNQGEGTGEFIGHLKDLTPGITYYARAYAVNKAGVAYGEEISFSTVSGLAEVTLSVTEVTYKRALANLTISNIGASAISNSGFVYSETSNPPTTSDIMWPSMSTELSAEYIVKDLTPGHTYYIRAFAQNGQGIAYSNTIQITTKSVPASVQDVDGNVYNLVVIGNRAWLSSDLMVTKYNNGDLIGTTTNSLVNEDTPKYQWPSNGNEANVPTYGRLYTYYAVMDSRKVCPSGTHFSTFEDWDDLINVVNAASWKLKTVGTSFWLAPNNGSTNETGFNSVGSGYRDQNGTYSKFKEQAYYSRPIEVNGEPTSVSGLYFTYSDGLMWQPNLPKKNGYSIRCVLD
jgi:uncharacterized protein (TIGR02145 family)